MDFAVKIQIHGSNHKLLKSSGSKDSKKISEGRQGGFNPLKPQTNYGIFRYHSTQMTMLNSALSEMESLKRTSTTRELSKQTPFRKQNPKTSCVIVGFQRTGLSLEQILVACCCLKDKNTRKISTSVHLQKTLLSSGNKIFFYLSSKIVFDISRLLRVTD